MAAITERGGRFLVRVRRKGYQTATKTFTLKTDARAWARRVEADMESGRWQAAFDAPAPTLREAIQEYRSTVAPKFKGAATYRYRFDEFEALHFAKRLVSEIRPADLALWRDTQLELHKPETVVRKLAMLSGIFTWAVKDKGWLEVNPMTSVRRPRAGPGRNRILSPQEVDCLLSAARDSKAPWLAPALTVLMTTAMRRGELVALTVGDVDFEHATARLHDTKNGSPRTVPLAPAARDALRSLVKAAQGRGEARLLPLLPGSVSTRFSAILVRARALHEADCANRGVAPARGFLDDVRLHDLRHHAVTAWASTGQLSLMELMAVSGHKTTRMLARYTHLDAAALAVKLASLSRADGQGAGPSRV